MLASCLFFFFSVVTKRLKGGSIHTVVILHSRNPTGPRLKEVSDYDIHEWSVPLELYNNDAAFYHVEVVVYSTKEYEAGE